MIGLEDTDVAKVLAALGAKAPKVAAAIVREDLTAEQVDKLLAILDGTVHHLRELRFRWFGAVVDDSHSSQLDE